MKICTKVFSINQRENYVSIQTDGVELRVMFLTDSILRIRAGLTMILQKNLIVW